ncbi:hypothetical protein K1719_041725 [Acacia pycnantha]|nr:hypothetical protein K1719_041725 [Acacia pycnantha]
MANRKGEGGGEGKHVITVQARHTNAPLAFFYGLVDSLDLLSSKVSDCSRTSSLFLIPWIPTPGILLVWQT